MTDGNDIAPGPPRGSAGQDSVERGSTGRGSGLDLASAKVGIGLSCRLCDRPDCRSRAFPPLEHRLLLDPASAGAPFVFSRPGMAA